MMISEVYVLFSLKLGFADQTLDCTVHLFRFPHLLQLHFSLRLYVQNLSNVCQMLC